MITVCSYVATSSEVIEYLPESGLGNLREGQSLFLKMTSLSPHNSAIH